MKDFCYTVELLNAVGDSFEKLYDFRRGKRSSLVNHFSKLKIYQCGFSLFFEQKAKTNQISVVMGAYNEEATISESIESILSQTYSYELQYRRLLY